MLEKTLRALLPLLRQKQPGAWRERILRNNSEWEKLMVERSVQEASPINPQRVFTALSPLLPDRVILTADSARGRQLVCPESEIA